MNEETTSENTESIQTSEPPASEILSVRRAGRRADAPNTQALSDSQTTAEGALGGNTPTGDTSYLEALGGAGLLSGEPVGGNESTESEEKVRIPVLNTETSRYEIKEVSMKRAEVITAGMMKESWEGVGGVALSTEGYEGAFHYAWVSKDRAHPTTNDALQKGYRPHYIERSAMESKGHVGEKIAGWDGSVITFGDMVLVACPKMAAISREEAYNERRAMERAKMSTASKEHIQNTLGERVNVSDAVSRVHENSRTDFGTQTLGAENAAELQAASVARAMEYQKSLDNPTKSFGGFQGKPGFNEAVPDSPNIRRLRELARAQSSLVSG